MHVSRPGPPDDPDRSATRPERASRLPKRDFVLLPLIFLGTIVFLLVGGELTARILYPQSDDVEPCEYQTPGGYRYHPFCTSHTKVWEGPWITQQFNACGYRTAESCAPRPPGSLRVVVMGSSTARGALVNYPESFAARASKALSALCGGLVDFQNLGTEPTDDNRIDSRIPEALALKPAAIVIALGTFDLQHLMDKPPPPGQSDEPTKFNLRSLVRLLRDSRLFLLMQYELYRDPDFQIRSFLLNGDAADYVRSPLSPAWQQRLNGLGDLLGRITAQTRPAGVPVLLVYFPERAQAAMATGHYSLPKDVDPFVLARALQATAAAHDVRFVDSTPEFVASHNFNSLFYLTDGHPTGGGHAAIADALEQGLRSEPTFSVCRKGANS